MDTEYCICLNVSLELAERTGNSPSLALGVSVQERSANPALFRPGQSGNPSGRPKSAFLRRKLMRQLRTELAAGIDRTDSVCDALISKAETGNVEAFTAIRDTVDGKPQSAGDGTSVVNNISVEILTIGGGQ